MVISRLIEKAKMKYTGWLMAVSVSSYIIYLFHTTFEGFAKAVIHKIPIFTDGANGLLFIANTTMVVAFGVIGPIILQRCILNKARITKVLFGLK